MGELGMAEDRDLFDQLVCLAMDADRAELARLNHKTPDAYLDATYHREMRTPAYKRSCAVVRALLDTLAVRAAQERMTTQSLTRGEGALMTTEHGEETEHSAAEGSGEGGSYRGWADLDLMGHKHLSGWIEEVVLFGVPLISIAEAGIDGALKTPAYYAPAALYALTPRSEAEIRAELAERRSWLRQAQAMVPPQLTAAEEDDEEEGAGREGVTEETESVDGASEEQRYPFSQTRRRARVQE